MESVKKLTNYIESLIISPISYVSISRVIALTMGNLDISPISPFNPISTKGEGKKIKPITRKILKLALDVIF